MSTARNAVRQLSTIRNNGGGQRRPTTVRKKTLHKREMIHMSLRGTKLYTMYLQIKIKTTHIFHHLKYVD